jgi:DNA-binding GntR family transcriptional regulator
MRERVEPTPARSGKLAAHVYEALKGEIQEFRLVAGDRFSETEVALRLGVSRTPVREALFRLRDEGFLGVESKLGWHVLPIDFGRLEQLYDLRLVIELASVARLCARADDVAELEVLKSVWLISPAERSEDGRTVGMRDEEFHAVLVRATGNAEMARVHWEVTERIRMIRRLDFTRPSRIDATYLEHGRILRAIVQKKSAQAQLLLKAHIEQSKAEVRKITLHTLAVARERAAAEPLS